MNCILSRDSYDNRLVERRRLVGVIVALVVFGGLWQVVRSPFIRANASASVGCSWRRNLVRSGLREAGYATGNWYAIDMSCQPRPGWAAWSVPETTEVLSDGTPCATRYNNIVVDGNFRLLGKFAMNYWQVHIQAPPLDIDTTGRWTIPLLVTVDDSKKNLYVQYVAVLRMGEMSSELIWLAKIDQRSWVNRRIWLEPMWQNTDGDGTHELVFAQTLPSRRPPPGVAAKPLPILAEFGLDRASGLLRTRVLTDGCGITPWDPPSDAPVQLEQTAKLEDVCLKLLPPPSLDTK